MLQTRPRASTVLASSALQRLEPLRPHLRFAAPIIGLALAIKLTLLALGALARQTILGNPYGTFWDRFTFWNAWDAPHYLEIARSGYQTTGEAANWIVFFPGYPYATRFADWVVPGNLLAAAFVVSGVASVAAALLLAYLARTDGADDAQAGRAVWFLLIFPTAYFLHIPYTEGFFLMLVLGSFLAARTGHWATAGIVGALAALSRINGILLIPALAVEAYLQYRRTGRFERGWLWIGAIGIGLLVYLGINQAYFGSPFHFQDVQRTVWFRELQSPVGTITRMLDSVGQIKPVDRQMVIWQEMLFLGIGVVAGLAAMRWSRPSYGVWILLNTLLFASTSWLQSTPRYALTLFPIFLLLAQATRGQTRFLAASAVSFAMLAWFTTLFALGHWAF